MLYGSKTSENILDFVDGSISKAQATIAFDQCRDDRYMVHSFLRHSVLVEAAAVEEHHLVEHFVELLGNSKCFHCYNRQHDVIHQKTHKDHDEKQHFHDADYCDLHSLHDEQHHRDDLGPRNVLVDVPHLDHDEVHPFQLPCVDVFHAQLN